MNSIEECAKELKKLVPSDWKSVVFSLFVRECKVNDKKAISKEFQCRCTSNSTDKIIDLVKFYEENFVAEDILFSMLNFWYKEYKKTPSENFIIFKLDNSGYYEIKRFPNISSDIDNKIIFNTIEECLKK